MRTIQLDGQSYVLMTVAEAKDLEQLLAYFGQFTGNLPQPTTETPPNATESPINDFAIPPASNEPSLPNNPPEIATKEEQKASIRIVSPESVNGVRPAQGRMYEYAEKFKNKELTQEDVTGTTRVRRVDLQNNPEDPLIKADGQRPKDKRLFYGPGVELDSY